MTELIDSFDVRRPVLPIGSPVLAAFADAGALSVADLHVARRIGRLGGESDERVLLAAALAVRSVREGSVCLDLADARRLVAPDLDPAVQLPWPDLAAWEQTVTGSPLVAVGPTGPADRPLRFVDRLLYLDRYWRQETLIREELDARAQRVPPPVDEERLRTAAARLFSGSAPDHQRLAACAAATGWLTIVAGGPGTGKTTTVARLLALLHLVLDRPPRVALAAPTGKAAARLGEAVADEARRLGQQGVLLEPPSASTLHRLLGWRPGTHSRFKHDRSNRLPYDVVVVDETSMVPLTMMSRLLEAVRPDSRLVLVGDPDQLASVEAGAVLGDLVHRVPPPRPDRAATLAAVVPADLAPTDEVRTELGNDVVRLRTVHRHGGAIVELAEAIRRNDADRVLAVLTAGSPDVEFVRLAGTGGRQVGLEPLRADVLESGRKLVDAARAGDAASALIAMSGHRLLCAHRRGPYGVAWWAGEVERWLTAEIADYGAGGEWHVGRPLLVTANDYDVHLYNGDTGVVIDAGGRATAAFGTPDDPTVISPTLLSSVETVHAMTVHRSQGSQFDHVSVLLPPPESPLLTRELLYTAVTRARTLVRVLGTEEAVRAAVSRPIVRASGLRRRPRDASGAAGPAPS